jgi:hypothetical protein
MEHDPATVAQGNDHATFLAPKFDNIPEALKSQPWAVWKAEPRSGKPGKFDKAPVCPIGGFKIGANQPEKFGTFEQAKAAYDRGGYTGVGVLLTAGGIVGVDIDYQEETFEAQPAAKQWLEKAIKGGAYYEKSPSGAGLRLFLSGALPVGGRRKSGPLEIYDNDRFLTVTGHVAGTRASADLIQGQHLVEEFVALLSPKAEPEGDGRISVSVRTGSAALWDIPFDLQEKLPSIFSPNEFSGSHYRALFEGATSSHDDDHSAADLALVGYMVRQGLVPDEADLVFRASGLFRDKWDQMRGATTYGQMTIAKAFEGHSSATGTGTLGKVSWCNTSDPNRYRPRYVPGGMPARQFVGPSVGPSIRLFPAAALSTLVALGAVGKTSLLVSMAAHIAAGKSWNGYPVNQHKVAIFFCEETEEEAARKFSAIVDRWSPAEQQAAMDNLRLVSLLGEDARLTTIERGQYQGSGTAEKMIAMLDDFGLKDGLVVLDHMQGFASGDLNVSETATSICREANKIVEATGAAVVFAAHISKANIKATELEQGFAVGSLAFENATRQLAGMLPMTQDLAKKYGLESERTDYAWGSVKY